MAFLKYLRYLTSVTPTSSEYANFNYIKTQQEFNIQFGKCMKLWIHENSVDDFQIAELLRLNTSQSGDEQISLKEYIDRMKEGQQDKNYIIGENIAVVSSSPVLERCARRVLR